MTYSEMSYPTSAYQRNTLTQVIPPPITQKRLQANKTRSLPAQTPQTQNLSDHSQRRESTRSQTLAATLKPWTPISNSNPSTKRTPPDLSGHTEIGRSAQGIEVIHSRILNWELQYSLLGSWVFLEGAVTTAWHGTFREADIAQPTQPRQHTEELEYCE